MNPTSYYTRLFVGRPGSTLDSPLEKGLEELGRKMTDDNDPKTDGVANAGYTYLGQFIDHDLTLDLTPLDQATSEMDRTPNFRTPFLDLDQLYGGGPNLSPFLYDRRAKRGEEHFLIGGTKASKLGDKDFPSSLDDLPRNSQGIALAGDPRQDENLILAQLHVAFLKLHNKTIAQPGLLAASPYYRKGQAGKDDLTDFEAARRVVMWHYQWIVRHDYLKKIIDPDIFSHLEEIHPRPKDRSKPFQIPVEFSVAAFRFGHSMVRDSYSYNEQHEDVDLLCLLELTGTGIKAPCKDVSRGKDVPFSLPADWVIDWRHFFLLGSSPLRHIVNSRKIDTKIANGLHGLPPHTANLFSVSVPGKPPEEHPLPVKTLWRGARVGLPSGQDVAKALGLTPLDDKQIASGPHEDILMKHGFHKDTPLWYYILKEAELPPQNGARLGPVGSRIVSDVIIGALSADPNSYVNVAGENSSIARPDNWWQPTLPGVEGSISAGTVSYGMRDLLEFIFPDLKRRS